MAGPVHPEAGDVRGVRGPRSQMADGNLGAAGVEHIEQVAVVLVLIVTPSPIVMPIPFSDGQTVGKQAAGKDSVREGQGAVIPDAERGDRALLTIGIVSPRAVVLGGAF